MSFTIPAVSSEFYTTALPVLILCVGAIFAMLQAVTKAFAGKAAVLGVLIVSLMIALISAAFGSSGVEVSYLSGGYLAGDIGRFGQTMILIVAVVVTVVMSSTQIAPKFFRGEITALFLMIVAGMLVMVASDDLITLFVGLELASIGLYALVGYVNPSRRSQEGAIKYYVLGSFATALMLFGFGLLYVAAGTLRLSELTQAMPKMLEHNWVRLGTLLSLAGLAFKLGLAPFHLWAPDAYEAAPTGITGFMATSVKIMILVFAIRLFSSLSPVFEVWLPCLMFLAMLSMVLGNIMALVQTSLKRMLAYSSIAHSGYMAVAVCAVGGTSADFPIAAVLYYLISYTVISLGAFSVIMWLEQEENDNLTLDDISGLAKSHPWAAAFLALFIFSFAGMPPTAGFIGKFFVFNAAISSQLYSLVIVGVLGSSISLFYYLRVVVKLYMTEPAHLATPLRPRRSLVVGTVLAVAGVLNLALGTVLAGPMLKSMEQDLTRRC